MSGANAIRRAARLVGASIGSFLLVAGGLACGGKQKKSEGTEKAKSSKADEEEKYDPETLSDGRKRNGDLSTGWEVKEYDLNRDQEVDQWTYRNDAGKTVRVARDMNFDGEVDLWQYMNESGAVVEEEMDLDMDGEVDVVSFYKGGEIRRKQMAINFKSNYDITKFYNNEGQLLRVERDKDDDDQTDVWEYYDDKGNRERIGWDENGDGVPDTFDDLR